MSKNEINDILQVRTVTQGLKGETVVPGDKSLSHRAVMFSAMAKGISQVDAWLAAGDTEATLACIQALGIKVERPETHRLIIHGGDLRAPDAPLDFDNAGTGIRLMAGIMAGQTFPSTLGGSSQLMRRPMKRIIEPLSQMGALIDSQDGYAPLHFSPTRLKGIEYVMPVASGQVKSAVLLAGLFAEGETVLIEPGPARDHTERMLAAIGADLTIDGHRISVRSGADLQPFTMRIPGDISSAAFLMVAALICPDSELEIKHVNINPTRTGILEVLTEMGAEIEVLEQGLEAGEPVAHIRIKTSALRACEIAGDRVVTMIDEFPIFMVAALCAEGETRVRDAKELRVKETDRLAVMTTELRKMGAVIDEFEDGFRIVGPQSLHGTVLDSYDDHRIAMSLAVAACVAEGTSYIKEALSAHDSFPGFAETVQALGANMMYVDGLPV